MFGLGPWELGIILVIVLIIFGAGKLPDIGAGIGKGIKNYKKGMSEAEIEKKEEPEKIDESNNSKSS